jgi:predicted nucleic acid-binding protein
MSVDAQVLYLAEPPMQYRVRPPVVIDCSVFAAFLFREEGATEALARMQGKSLHAPFLLEVEMASVALKKHQKGFSELAKAGIMQFETSDILFHALSPSSTLDLAIRYQLTAYDAAYLWLATQLKCPLLTFDERLGKAAQGHLALLP